MVGREPFQRLWIGRGSGFGATTSSGRGMAVHILRFTGFGPHANIEFYFLGSARRGEGGGGGSVEQVNQAKRKAAKTW